MWCLILCLLCIAKLGEFTNQTSYKPSNSFYEVEFNLIQHKVVPDAIPHAPEEKLEVFYSNGIKLTLGNILRPYALRGPPFVKWNEIDSKVFHTLLMISPDLPSRANPILRQWQHWLVVNMPGNKITQAETIIDYIGPGPLPKTGFHRYVFLLFKQQSKLFFDEPRIDNSTAEHRGNFCVQSFIDKYSLGPPVAINFFRSIYVNDNYLPQIFVDIGLE